MKKSHLAKADFNMKVQSGSSNTTEARTNPANDHHGSSLPRCATDGLFRPTIDDRQSSNAHAPIEVHANGRAPRGS